jgi:hypothetical protein
MCFKHTCLCAHTHTHTRTCTHTHTRTRTHAHTYTHNPFLSLSLPPLEQSKCSLITLLSKFHSSEQSQVGLAEGLEMERALIRLETTTKKSLKTFVTQSEFICSHTYTNGLWQVNWPGPSDVVDRAMLCLLPELAQPTRARKSYHVDRWDLNSDTFSLRKGLSTLLFLLYSPTGWQQQSKILWLLSLPLTGTWSKSQTVKDYPRIPV